MPRLVVFALALLGVASAGCGRTLLTPIPPMVDAGPGGPDAGPEAERCSWSYGAETVTINALASNAFVALGAYRGRSGEQLRILTRRPAENDWTVNDYAVETLSSIATFTVTTAGPVDGAALFGQVERYLEVRGAAFGCLTRNIELRDAIAGTTTLSPMSSNPDCFGFAAGPEETVAAVVTPSQSSLHAVEAQVDGSPPEVVAVGGPLPVDLGPTFGWRTDETFEAVHLAPDLFLRFLRLPREGPIDDRLGLLPSPGQLAPDVPERRVFVLARDAMGRLAIAESSFEADGLGPLVPLSSEVDYEPDPTTALPLVLNELILPTRNHELRFVPVFGGAVGVLGPPEPGARDLLVVAHPPTRRAVVVYGVPPLDGGPGVRVQARRLDCRR